MKITDDQHISSNKATFFKGLFRSVAWPRVIEKIRERFRIAVQDEIRFVGGELVVDQSRVAYRLDVDVTVRLSMLCDQSGNCLRISSFREGEDMTKPDMENPETRAAIQRHRKKMAKMAPSLTRMMEDINETV